MVELNEEGVRKSYNNLCNTGRAGTVCPITKERLCAALAEYLEHAEQESRSIAPRSWRDLRNIILRIATVKSAGAVSDVVENISMKVDAETALKLLDEIIGRSADILRSSDNALLTDMRMQVEYTEVVTMPIPLYERIKAVLREGK